MLRMMLQSMQKLELSPAADCCAAIYL